MTTKGLESDSSPAFFPRIGIEDDDDDDEKRLSYSDSSTTISSRPDITKGPIMISSPRMPDEMVLPNIPSHLSITDSSETMNSVSGICLDQSEFDTTSHMSTLIIEALDNTNKSSTIEAPSSTSSICVPGIQIDKIQPQLQQSTQTQQTKSKEQSKQNQQPKNKEQNKQNQLPKCKEQSKQTPQQKQKEQTLPQQQNTPLSKQLSTSSESIDIISTTDSITCMTGTFSNSHSSSSSSLSSTTAISSSSKNFVDESTSSAGETIKTYFSKNEPNPLNQRTLVSTDSPTICCFLL